MRKADSDTSKVEFPLLKKILGWLVGIAFLLYIPLLVYQETYYQGPAVSVGVVVAHPREPETIYVGVGEEGVYKSTDAGLTWTAINSGLTASNAYDSLSRLDVYKWSLRLDPYAWATHSIVRSMLTNVEVCALAIDPQRPEHLYAGTKRNGIYKSINGGAHWIRVDDNLLSDNRIYAFAIDSTSGIVYAGTDKGVYTGTNDGRKWSPSGLPEFYSVYTLLVDSDTVTTIYAGTNGGVYKSTDEGATWSPANDGLPTYYAIRSLVIDSSVTPSAIYAATSGVGIYRTTNGGKHWVPSDEKAAYSINALAIDPSDNTSEPTKLYAGVDRSVWKSTDGGKSWTEVALQRPSTDLSYAYANAPISALMVHPDTNIIYVGDAEGNLYVGTDGKADWIETDRIEIDREFYGIRGRVSASWGRLYTRSLMYTVTLILFLKFFKASKPWQVNLAAVGVFIFILVPSLQYFRHHRSWGNTHCITSLVADTSRPTLYAAAGDGGFLRSSDNGTTWETIKYFNVENSQEFVESTYTLAMNPDSSELYIGTSEGIFRSLDKGESWSPANEGLPGLETFTHTFTIGAGTPITTQVTLALDPADAIAIDPVITTTVYVAIKDWGIYKSLDSGNTWMATAFPKHYSVHTLAVNPFTTTTLYAGTNGGLYRSMDNGDSWVPISHMEIPAYYNIHCIAIHPFTPTLLYIGTDGGVYKSTNNGDNWIGVNKGLPDFSVRALAIDPTETGTVYAGVDGFVYKTVDGGENWVEIDIGSNDNRNISSLALNPTENSLHIGTQSCYIYSGVVGGVEWSGHKLDAGRVEEFISWLIDYWVSAGKLVGVCAGIILALVLLWLVWQFLLQARDRVREIGATIDSALWWESLGIIYVNVVHTIKLILQPYIVGIRKFELTDVTSGKLIRKIAADTQQLSKDGQSVLRRLRQRLSRIWQRLAEHGIWAEVAAGIILTISAGLLLNPLGDFLERTRCCVCAGTVLILPVAILMRAYFRMQSEAGSDNNQQSITTERQHKANSSPQATK